MNVRELINKLSKCNPDATVCIEAWMSPEAKVVKEFETEIGKCVYIGDDLDNLEYEMSQDDDFKDGNEKPCDYGDCPYNAEGGYDCRNYCGLGVDENEEDDYYEYDEDYVPSATNGDYGPSNPYDAPGMKISDFISGVIY